MGGGGSSTSDCDSCIFRKKRKANKKRLSALSKEKSNVDACVLIF
jgi:hypothetical protein